MPAHTPDDVRALVERIVGRRVAAIHRDPVGASNVTYFVTLADGSACVARVSPATQCELLRQELWAYSRARAVGVPTPEVLAADPAPRDFPEPYLVMRRLPGTPAHQARFNRAERSVVLEQLGHYLARLHTIQLPGFGRLVAAGTTFTGRFATLGAAILDEFDHLTQALPESVLSRQRAEELRHRLARERARLDLPQAVLIHGDYQLKNVLVQGTCVTGIVDFENLAAGDPVADFAALHFWSRRPADDLSALRRGYAGQSLFEARFLPKLHLHELLLALAVLWWEDHFQDTAGIAAVQARLRAIEDTLDAF